MNVSQNRCFVCNEIISGREGIRFEENGISVVIHETCLSIFGRIAQKAFELKSIVSAPDRPISLAEFLDEKQPRSQPELIVCIVYYLEQKEEKILEFTTKEIREELPYIRDHIPDVGIALSNAIRRTPYIVRIGKRNGQHLYRLTKQGVQLVEELPREH